MPAYEFSVLLKTLPRTEVAAALKRVGTALLDQGVTIQKLENLGLRNLPFRVTQQGNVFLKAHYFIFTFTGSPTIFKNVTSICKSDLDLLRHGIVPVYKDLNKECTLDEELLPPAHRKSVHELMERGKKFRERRKKFYWHERDYSYFDIYM